MRLKACIGYTMAILAIPITLATFFGMTFFSHKLVDITGVKVSPWYTGGEIIKTIDHGTYRTLIHRPVFDGLISEKTTGFIQIDWEPGANLPLTISDEIDYNSDGVADFCVEYDTQANTAILKSYNQNVIGLEGSYVLKQRRAVRISLQNR